MPGSNWYWISWYNAQFSAGYGNVVGSNLVVTYNDPWPLPMTSLYVGTYTGNVAEWLIPGIYWSLGNIHLTFSF